MATETYNSFGDVGALRFVSVKGWISGIYFLLYRKPLNQNKMKENIVTAVIIGYWLGYAIGWLIEKATKKVDGKLEIDQYMTKVYGDKWINL